MILDILRVELRSALFPRRAYADQGAASIRSAHYIIITYPHYEQLIGVAGDRKIKFVAEPIARQYNMIQFVAGAARVIGFQGELTIRNELSAHFADNGWGPAKIA